MSRVAMGFAVMLIGLIAVLVRYPPAFVRGAFQASSNSVHKDASPATVASVNNPFRARVASSGAIETLQGSDVKAWEATENGRAATP